MIIDHYKAEQSEVCDCMIAALVNAALYFRKEYQFAYSGLWVFEYKRCREDLSFWKRLYTEPILRPREQLEKWHGIKTITNLTYDFEKFKKELMWELSENKPVILGIDGFYCPWIGMYHKVHMIHYFLIIGYEKEAFICSDPYVSLDNKYLYFEELKGKNILLEYTVFRFCEPVYSIEEWGKVVAKILESKDDVNGNISDFNKMKLFADDLINNFRIVDEMGKENSSYTFELFYQMKYVSHSRQNFAQFLLYLREKIEINGLDEPIELMLEASRYWRRCWLKFTKCVYMKNKDKIAEEIKEIRQNIYNISDIETRAGKLIGNVISLY